MMNSVPSWFRYLLVAFTAFILGLISIWVIATFLIKEVPESEKKETTQTTTTKLKSSNAVKELITTGTFSPIKDVKAPPKVLVAKEKGALSAYDPQTKKTQSLNVVSVNSGGTLNKGAGSPLLSPGKKLVAYVGEEDGNVWIVDTEARKNTQISTQAKKATEVYYGTSILISGWSSDDRYLGYHVEINDESYQGTVKGQFKPNVLGGFYVADLEKGKVYFIANLENFVSFLPSSTKIVYEKQETNKTTLYTYDIVSGEIEILTEEPIKGVLPGQYNFSNDAKYVTFMQGKNVNGELKLVDIKYATLNNKDAQTIASGSWGKMQWPHISPNGKSVAYQKSVSEDCGNGTFGCPKDDIIIYNLQSKKTKSLDVEGVRIQYWFDDKRVVVTDGVYGDSSALLLINVETKMVTKVADNVSN